MVATTTKVASGVHHGHLSQPTTTRHAHVTTPISFTPSPDALASTLSPSVPVGFACRKDGRLAGYGEGHDI